MPNMQFQMGVEEVFRAVRSMRSPAEVRRFMQMNGFREEPPPSDSDQPNIGQWTRGENYDPRFAIPRAPLRDDVTVSTRRQAFELPMNEGETVEQYQARVAAAHDAALAAEQERTIARSHEQLLGEAMARKAARGF